MSTRAAPGSKPVTVTVVPDPTGAPVPLAERIAAVVAAHPAVAGLHGGTFGAVATYLPGRRLTGVRVGEGDEPVELGVVVHLGSSIPGVVDDLRREVSGMCGGAAVDITVADVAVPPDLALRLVADQGD